MRPQTLHTALNRFPLKQGWDGLSLAQILLRGDLIYGEPLSLARRLSCLGFYFSPGVSNRLYVVPPRSGTTWGQLGMELALDLAAGGDGEYSFENNRFWPRDGRNSQLLDWRVPSATMDREFHRPGGPLLGTQYFWQSRDPYFRIRCARLKTMRIVFVTRSIFATLESGYFKLAGSPVAPNITFDDEDSFDWDFHLTRAIEFFNSWADVLTWHPSVRHFRYEDLKADPVAGHKEMLEFWGLPVPEECIAEGFRRASKKEMMKRLPRRLEDENLRLSTRGTDRRGVISASRRQFIANRLQRELISDYGYDFSADCDYGVAYD